MNNIAEPNKLFRIKDNGKFEQINLEVGLEARWIWNWSSSCRY